MSPLTFLLILTGLGLCCGAVSITAARCRMHMLSGLFAGFCGVLLTPALIWLYILVIG